MPIGGILGIGFVSASSAMVMTHGRGTFPDRLIGRGIATINTCVMLGVACMQTLSGIIVGASTAGRRRPHRNRVSRPVRSALVLIVAVSIYSHSRTSGPAMKCAPGCKSTRLELPLADFDGDLVAVDVGRAVAGQEQDGAGDVLRHQADRPQGVIRK